jgi:hypothetical protein
MPYLLYWYKFLDDEIIVDNFHLTPLHFVNVWFLWQELQLTTLVVSLGINQPSIVNLRHMCFCMFGKSLRFFALISTAELGDKILASRHGGVEGGGSLGIL